jgi:hypothetical protein
MFPEPVGLSAQAYPEQHSPVFLHCGGFVHGTHLPAWHLNPAQQELEVWHAAGFVQQVSLTGIVPTGHSHSQVRASKTFPGGQETQIPVPAHMNVPGWHAHCAVEGSQKLLQHSSFSRHPCPPSKQRPAAFAEPAPKSDATPPTVATPKIFSACRLEVVVESVLANWSNSWSRTVMPSPLAR